jgi:hypothetical protein
MDIEKVPNLDALTLALQTVEVTQQMKDDVMRFLDEPNWRDILTVPDTAIEYAQRHGWTTWLTIISSSVLTNAPQSGSRFTMFVVILTSILYILARIEKENKWYPGKLLGFRAETAQAVFSKWYPGKWIGELIIAQYASRCGLRGGSKKKNAKKLRKTKK